MSEEVRERKRTVNDNIWFFLAEFLEKWNCHCVLEKCQFYREDHYLIFDKFSKPIRHLSGGVELGVHVWSMRRDGSGKMKNLGVISE